ncbi:MAG TPA: M20/M25/M40 family metallo-hydrolase [Candidatus Polarisedimenticolaceae bacterium]|nr:M20/M25/M40 family metallo-hydrolase [Candidatus Polarisedimenticolaceae bacterium]
MRTALGLLALVAVAAAPAGPADAMRRHVTFLADAQLEGRMTGSPGERRAADYLVEQLRRIGAVPFPGHDDFRVPFEFTAGMNDSGSRLECGAAGAEPARAWSAPGDVQALSFSEMAEVSGPVVFAGYGLVVPESQGFGYDSYVGIDVKDKVVLVLRYYPEDVAPETRTILSRYAGLRYKAMHARERGARAVLVLTGPRSPNAGELVPTGFDTALSGSGIAAASISGAVGAELFRRAGKDVEQAQRALDDGNPHVAGFELAGVQLKLDARVKRERKTGFNVLGYLPARVEGEAAAAPGAVVLGAHYDHLGHGDLGNSLARKGETGRVHPGADDNASGVAMLLALAERLAAAPHTLPYVLACWSGEELGLLGSAAFVKSDLVDRSKVAAYVNFDMVGRVKDNRLSIQGVGSSPLWTRLIEQSNTAVGLDVQAQQDPYLPTDATSFYQAGVPAVSFFSGNHDDYHRPTDTADRLHYDEMARVVDLAERLVRRLGSLAEPPEYTKIDRPPSAAGSRDGLRAYTGTIPDYTSEVEGLRLSGVIGGGPAEQAGLREGDVIVEFAGRKISNVYDYTYALDAVKIGEPVTVVFLRDGQRQTVRLTPGSRK